MSNAQRQDIEKPKGQETRSRRGGFTRWDRKDDTFSPPTGPKADRQHSGQNDTYSPLASGLGAYDRYGSKRQGNNSRRRSSIYSSYNQRSYDTDSRNPRSNAHYSYDTRERDNAAHCPSSPYNNHNPGKHDNDPRSPKSSAHSRWDAPKRDPKSRRRSSIYGLNPNSLPLGSKFSNHRRDRPSSRSPRAVNLGMGSRLNSPKGRESPYRVIAKSSPSPRKQQSTYKPTDYEVIHFLLDLDSHSSLLQDKYQRDKFQNAMAHCQDMIRMHVIQVEGEMDWQVTDAPVISQAQPSWDQRFEPYFSLEDVLLGQTQIYHLEQGGYHAHGQDTYYPPSPDPYCPPIQEEYNPAAQGSCHSAAQSEYSLEEGEIYDLGNDGLPPPFTDTYIPPELDQYIPTNPDEYIAHMKREDLELELDFIPTYMG
ncbi:hypothetical protein GLAREA_07879 [Glarea lozoyensis ATCC 20868]|uniref:Uncharacterized protein n=1 Tax=Glarea lozoyensis (strain ATCC 20868 / MF5171) TaxID=1116229 RepID=S3D4N4_GLAL2|nr:uncharacterized protein GLAREA_07879 [Glarea lozoyensis ATCC 20868]EPE32745.1 hypothetical protein GLAREA_07879 [Glarea lozoyensis ATCC 20868]